MEKEKCKWTREKDQYIDWDTWNTICGNMFTFTVGTPDDNDFRYCPYCGKEIEQIDDVDDDDFE